MPGGFVLITLLISNLLTSICLGIFGEDSFCHQVNFEYFHIDLILESIEVDPATIGEFDTQKSLLLIHRLFIFNIKI